MNVTQQRKTINDFIDIYYGQQQSVHQNIDLDFQATDPSLQHTASVAFLLGLKTVGVSSRSFVDES